MSALVAIPGCGELASTLVVEFWADPQCRAAVPTEPRVLARDRGADQVRGYLIQRAPALVDAVPFDKAEQHQGRPRRREDAIKRNQHDRADHKANNAVEPDTADPPQSAGFGTRGDG